MLNLEEKTVNSMDRMMAGKTFGHAFFPSMFFCGEATKKASIDGLKWWDLVMGRWWLVNFKVSAVRCPVSQRVSCVKLRKAGVAM